MLRSVVEVSARVDTLARDLTQAKTTLVEALVTARCAGMSFDSLARAIIKRRTGRSGSPLERRRESTRLRQLLWRERVTARNAKFDRNGIGSVPPVAGCDRGGNTVNDQKHLIRRTTTVEEYAAGDGLDSFEDSSCPVTATPTAGGIGSSATGETTINPQVAPMPLADADISSTSDTPVGRPAASGTKETP